MDRELAKRWNISFRVPGRICFDDGLMLFGGGSRSGGCFGPLGATVPQNDSLKAKKAAHGPRHPLVLSSEFCFAILCL